MLDTQLEERFGQPPMHKVAEVEQQLEDATAGKGCAVPDAVKELYGRDVDVKRLEVQLKMLPDITAQDASDASVAETAAVHRSSACTPCTRRCKRPRRLARRLLSDAE